MRHAQCLAGSDGRALQPVDADRLLVACLVLETDIDEIARLQHLLAGLGEARLVPIERLQRLESGQERRQRQQHQECAGAGVAG